MTDQSAYRKVLATPAQMEVNSLELELRLTSQKPWKVVWARGQKAATLNDYISLGKKNQPSICEHSRPISVAFSI